MNPYGRVDEPLSLMNTLGLWVGPEDEQDSFSSPIVILLRPNKSINMCVFQVSRPYLGFYPDPEYFIVSKMSNLWEKCFIKCNFYIKYFDKIKCYADRPYLVFSELKPQAHKYIFWGLIKIFDLIPNMSTFNDPK